MENNEISRSKILAVDDNAMNIAIMQEVFDGICTLKTAASGQEALDTAEMFSPDIILLDIMMPGIDGYEVCRRIRANPNLRLSKVIMVSAKSMTSERIKGYEAGADDYIVKPFDADELLAKIRVYLRLKTVEELDRAKSDFNMTVTHELRTPMTIAKNVIGNALANVYGSVDGKLQEELKIAEDNITRLGNIVANFFDIAKIEAGKMEMNKSSFDMCSIASKTVDSLAGAAGERNIKLNVSCKKTNVQIYADRDKITKVLRLLVENAIKFTNEQDYVEVGIEEFGDGVRADVKDNGPGIEAGNIEKIFDRFVQIQKNIGPGEHGTGLGLSIAKQFVEMHRGRIWVESVLGKGTTFSFTIPTSLN